MGQGDVIEILKRMGGRATTSELSKRMGVSKSTVTALTRKLESQGIIQRVKERGTGEFINKLVMDF
jgi:Mn-dependent DtxR family transcriptional regulator